MIIIVFYYSNFDHVSQPLSSDHNAEWTSQPAAAYWSGKSFSNNSHRVAEHPFTRACLREQLPPPVRDCRRSAPIKQLEEQVGSLLFFPFQGRISVETRLLSLLFVFVLVVGSVYGCRVQCLQSHSRHVTRSFCWITFMRHLNSCVTAGALLPLHVK